VHLTRNRAGQGKVRRYVHVHGLAVDDGDMVEIDGFRVPSLARTVLDIACSLRHYKRCRCARASGSSG
jgi:hypothetical protein